MFFMTTDLGGSARFGGIIIAATVTTTRILVLMLSASLKTTLVCFVICLVVLCITAERPLCTVTNITTKYKTTIIKCRLFSRVGIEITT